MITPAIIACGDRYVQMLPVCVGSFLRHHKSPIYIIVDNAGKQKLSGFEADNLFVVDVEEPLRVAKSMVKHRDFLTIECYNDGKHNRVFSALKPVIIDLVVKQQTEYTLSLDVDTLFTGNIIQRTEEYLKSLSRKFDLYLVARVDPRMRRVSSMAPGSGFTLWRSKGVFTKSFVGWFNHDCVGRRGGSQDLINKLSGHLSFHEITDPLLHFVSPDIAVPKPTPDSEILRLKPAYIHFHGPKSFERMTKYDRLFHGE